MRDGSRVMTMRGATLSRVIQTAADRGRSAATDRELLRRFAEAGDQAAFEALVRRHTGLVLSVCRRALPNAQDAEDACQAVFLILARKARGGRWQPSIANWLFATARKVARDLRRTADRRARREGRAAVREAVEPVDQMTGRELLAAIDEELGRLPPRYREPLLLYCQAELSRDEIAARLGVPAGTVKIRLERGRKKLGAALTGRGLTLGAGLLALTATSRAGASPPRVLEAVRAALAGNAPPAVAALAQGAAMNGVVKKVALATGALMAAAAIGLGLGEPRATTAGPQPEKAMPAKASEKADGPAAKPEKKDEVKTRTVTGKVLDPVGQPVAGAELIHVPINGTATVAGKTAADGTFSVTVALREPGSYLFPVAAGFGPGEFLMPATNTPAEVTFKLVKDTPIRGRVIDTQGRPVAGASVVVRSICGYGETMDDFLAAWQKRPPDGHRPREKWFAGLRNWQDRKPPAASGLFAAVTDAGGRFALAHAGSERLVELHVRGTGIAETEAVVVTRAGFDPAPYNRATAEKLRGPDALLGWHPILYSPESAVVAEAEKPIRGVVREAATGKPRAGVAVTLREQRGAGGRLPDLTATTDAQGRYEIRGARKASSYGLSVKRDAAAGLLGRTVEAADTPAYEPVTADIAVARGVVLTGRLTDGATGKPVRGFACAGVLFDNPFVKDRPELATPDCYGDWAYTDQGGVYRTVVPPGPVLLMAGPVPTETDDADTVYLRYRRMRPDPDYPQYFDRRFDGFRSPGGSTTLMQGQYCKVLKLNPDQREVTADIAFERAAAFPVKVRGPDGKPAADLLAAGVSASEAMYATRCAGDTCAVYELDPARPRRVVLYDTRRHLAASLTLTGKEQEPLVVTLGLAGKIKGRLVDPAGQPIARAMVHLDFRDRAADHVHEAVHGSRRDVGRAVETNAAGEFALDRVLPGLKFLVYARKGNKDLEPPDWKAGGFEARGGETVDLGTIRLKPERGE